MFPVDIFTSPLFLFAEFPPVFATVPELFIMFAMFVCVKFKLLLEFKSMLFDESDPFSVICPVKFVPQQLLLFTVLEFIF